MIKKSAKLAWELAEVLAGEAAIWFADRPWRPATPPGSALLAADAPGLGTEVPEDRIVTEPEALQAALDTDSWYAVTRRLWAVEQAVQENQARITALFIWGGRREGESPADVLDQGEPAVRSLPEPN